jgi:hypothetical protein
MFDSNISERKFHSVAKKMLILEYKMSQILYPLGWLLPSPIAKSGTLVIDIKKNEKNFGSDIVLVFDDHPNQVRFTFYVSKFFDENNFRYSLRENLFENKQLSFFEKKINTLVTVALGKYNSWSKEDIITLGIKVELSN